MVLQFILRRKTTSSVKIFIWTELKTLQRITFCAHAIVLTGDNTFVIRSQSSQSKKLNFLTWPDLAFGFVKKRSGFEINLDQAYPVKMAFLLTPPHLLNFKHNNSYLKGIRHLKKRLLETKNQNKLKKHKLTFIKVTKWIGQLVNRERLILEDCARRTIQSETRLFVWLFSFLFLLRVVRKALKQTSLFPKESFIILWAKQIIHLNNCWFLCYFRAYFPLVNMAIWV